jgi:hypothetical protein
VAVGAGEAAVAATAPGGAEGNAGAVRDVRVGGGWRRADSSGAAADTATGRGLISSCNSQSVTPQIEARTPIAANANTRIADIAEFSPSRNSAGDHCRIVRFSAAIMNCARAGVRRRLGDLHQLASLGRC